MDSDIREVLERLMEHYDIPGMRLEEFLDLIDAVIDGKIFINKMPDFIKEAFGVSAEDAKAMAIQLAGHRLLPLEFYLPGIEKQIIAWGGNIADFPDIRIKDDPTTIASILRDHAKSMGLELPDHLMKRFVYLCRGYITKERAKEATATLMKRPLTIGGLGLKEEQIEKLLTWLEQVDLSAAEDFQNRGSGIGDGTSDQKIDVPTSSPKDEKSIPRIDPSSEEPPRGGKEEDKVTPSFEPKPEPVVPILTPSEVEEKKSISQNRSSTEHPGDGAWEGAKTAPPPAIIPTTALANEVPTIAGELIEDHEKAEVEVHRQALKKVPVAKDDHLPVMVERAAGVLLEHAPSKKLTKKKALTLAESVVKGRLDTSRLYQQLKEVHGFGMVEAQLVIKPLMDAKKTYESSILMTNDKRGEKSNTRIDLSSAEPSRDGKDVERSLMNRRHAALTKSPSNQSIEPVLPGARVSAARTKDEELAAQHERVDTEAEQMAKDEDRPAPVKVKLSTPSAPPKAPQQEKPRVTDVKFTRQLIGPVQELGTMGIADFRRLSSDPQEAVRKILDTLSLLEEHDYEDRIAGIAAWRKSPMNRLYLEMVHQGLLEGGSVAEVATTRRNQGQESLSPAELQAIVSLNTQIAF